MSFKDRLIDDWTKAFRYWSMKLCAIGVVFQGVWIMMPADDRANIPGGQFISLALFALVAISRVMKQSDQTNG